MQASEKTLPPKLNTTTDHNPDNNSCKAVYIQTVTDQIRCKKARTFIAEEISGHIEDQMEALVAEGMEPLDAEKTAVKEMGDPVKVGCDLDHIHRPKLDWKLLVMIAILTLAGLAVQYHSTDNGSESWFFRQVIYTVIGFAAMVLVYFADYTILGKRPFLMWCGWAVFLIFGTLTGFPSVMGRVAAGQHRIYPLLILLVPLYAGVLYRFRGTSYPGFLCCGCFAASGILLCDLIPSMTAMVKLMIIFAAMLTFAVSKGWFYIRKAAGYLTIYGSIGFLTVLYIAYSIFGSGYHSQRLKAALHPEKNADELGYVSVQIRELLKDLKWVGSTKNTSSNLQSWISDTISSDTILIYVFATFGLLTGLLLLLVLYAVIAKMLLSSLKQKNQLGSMVGFGCGCFFLTETVVYVMCNLGFHLFSPMYLPFFSKSGKGIIVMYALLGLTLSVYRNTNIIREKSAKVMPRYHIRIERIS